MLRNITGLLYSSILYIVTNNRCCIIEICEAEYNVDNMYLLIAHNRAVTPDMVYYYISLSSNMANIKRQGKRFFTIVLITKFQEIIYRAFLHGRLTKL